MKKYYALYAILALMVTGCEKEPDAIEPAHVLYAIAERNGTKAEVSDAGTFSWTVSDAISVYKAGAVATYTANTSAEKSDFTLASGPATDAPDYAVYPAPLAANASDYADPNHLLITLPDHYTIAEGATSGTAKMPMLAVGDGSDNLFFKHLGGMLKINAYSVPEQVVKFVATFPGKRINGVFAADATAENPIIETEDEWDDSRTSVTFTYASRSSAETGVTLYIPLPVGNYGGVTVDMVNSSNQVLASFSRGPFTIVRKKLFYISAANKTFSLGGIFDAATIRTDNTITLPVTEDGIALDFSNISDFDGTLTLQYGTGDHPKNIYIISPANIDKHQVTLSGNLINSTVYIVSGTFKATSMTTAVSTLVVDEDATVGEVTIQGGNAKISGKVDNIIVPEGATADGGSTPITVTITSTASAADGNPVTLQASTRVKVIANVQVSLVVNNGAPIECNDISTWTQFSSCWDGSSTAPLSQGEDAGHFDIYTAQQFARFRDDVNNGNTYAGKTVTLKCGIDLGGYDWTPIGLGDGNDHSESQVFLGTFDGGNYPISGLNIARTGARSFAGLFGTIQAVNEQHITFRNVWIADIQAASECHAGGILGRYLGWNEASSLAIEGCVVEYGQLVSTAWNDGGIKRGGNLIGGIVGEATGHGITITQSCSQNLQIQGTRDIGGIAGKLESPDRFTQNEIHDCIITQIETADLETGVDMETVGALVGRKVGEWDLDASNDTSDAGIVLSNAGRWDGTSTTALNQIDADTYEIRSAAQFAQLAVDVNAGTTYAGKTVRLSADIDLNNKSWNPIGSGSHSFLGTFEGNNHVVYNLNVTRTGENSLAGLFGNIRVTDNRTVTIQNLLLVQPTVSSEHQAAGILARYQGENSGAHLVIDRCYVLYAQISSTPWNNSGTAQNGNQVGGIVGTANGNGISISNCYVYNSSFQGARDIGSIAGSMASPELFTGNEVWSNIITQSYPVNYETADMTTIHEMVGCASNWVVNESNNYYHNITIYPQN